ncbi:MAG: diacylglycerol kinase [Gammaproteobacteria bacterium]|nr:diacylglycerol kinase [Gammaproteobacteria bacterium]
MTEEKKPTGIARIIKAATYSWQGLVACYKTEAAFRQELALAVVLLPFGLWLGDTGIERALLAGSVLLVLIVELINTGVEYVVDRIGDEYHELSGKAKDIASAAVFLALVNLALVWALVLFF